MAFSHWDYFAAIEKEFKRLTESIGYTSRYYSVCSRELADLILKCGSGFETAAQIMCRSIKPDSSPKTLGDFHPIITTKYPGFTGFKIVLPSYNMALMPWKDWTPAHGPDWWDNGYIPLRHDPEKSVKAGNYWNAIYAAAGLLCGVLYYHKEMLGDSANINPAKAPKIFLPKDYAPPPNKPGWTFTTPDDRG